MFDKQFVALSVRRTSGVAQSVSSSGYSEWLRANGRNRVEARVLNGNSYDRRK
jgi:hypothetical protein